MTNDLGADLTNLEARLSVAEQQTVTARNPAVSVVTNASGTPTMRDSLRWQAGWESHTKLISRQPNPALPNYPDLAWVHYTGNPTLYAPAQAIRVGPMCFLSGLVVRTGATLAANTDHSSLIARLPVGWRPRFRQLFICAVSGGYPGYGRIEVWPDTGNDAGGLYLMHSPYALAASSWIALQLAFPCIDAATPTP